MLIAGTVSVFLIPTKGTIAIKHLMISAKIGYGRSLDMIKELLGWTCDKRPIRRGIEGVWRCHGRNEKPPSRRSEGTCWHSTRRLVLLQRKSLKIWRSYTFIQNDYRRFYHLLVIGICRTPSPAAASPLESNLCCTSADRASRFMPSYLIASSLHPYETFSLHPCHDSSFPPRLLGNLSEPQSTVLSLRALS